MGKIFLSYASDDRALAKDIQVRLRQHGYDVFFDEDTLKPSDGYDQMIRRRIARSDVMVFLCSEHSLKDGRYTLTELRMAQRQWANPQGRVLPVLIGDTGFDDIPSYLRGLSAFRAQGDAVSEIAMAAEDLADAHVRRRRRRFGIGAGVTAAAAALGLVISPQLSGGDIEETQEETQGTTPGEGEVGNPVGEGDGATDDAGDLALGDPDGHVDEPWTDEEQAQMTLTEYLSYLELGETGADVFPEGNQPDLFAAFAPGTVINSTVAQGFVEGAAGSQFATLPVTITFREDANGTVRTMFGTVILRRRIRATGDDFVPWEYFRAEVYTR